MSQNSSEADFQFIQDCIKILSKSPKCFQEPSNVWYYANTTVSKKKLFLIKYITKKHYTRRFNLHYISFLGVFQGPEIDFIIRILILNIQ